MIYGQNGIRPDSDKVEDIQAIDMPATKIELHDLPKKDVSFLWDNDLEYHFKTLENLISTNTCLQYYDMHAPVKLMVDTPLTTSLTSR